MNHTLWTAAGARVLAMAFVIAGLAACSERVTTTSKGREAATPESSAVVIGTAPAQPTGDPPGTTPGAGSTTTTEVTKSVESNAMPQPGQPNDHSTLAPKPSQKADEMATTAAEGKSANNGERTR